MRRTHAIFGFAVTIGLVLTIIAWLVRPAASETTGQAQPMASNGDGVPMAQPEGRAMVLHEDGHMVPRDECLAWRVMTTIDCMSEPQGGSLCGPDGVPKERQLCADEALRWPHGRTDTKTQN